MYPRQSHMASLIGVSMLLATAAGCIRPGDYLARSGDEIVVCGQLFHTGTPVVLWMDPNGYDAYEAHRHFEPDKIMPANPVDKESPSRFGDRRNLPPELQEKIAKEGWTLANLQQQVDQFVFHYDVCGTSRRCFQVLQDMRGLSVHFMLDVDGTLYQTLDLKERAWHASSANDRSVGIEIANIGAYGEKSKGTLDKWYTHDANGWPVITFPPEIKETGIRTPGFVGKPARKELVTGKINGADLSQYDYTPEQYAAIIKLVATMHRVFPKMKLDAPRNADGSLKMDVFGSKEEQAAFSGFMGHWHETKGKVDPGPAFDWERVLRGARWELFWHGGLVAR